MITHKVNINLIKHRPRRRFRFPRIDWEAALGRAATALTTGIAIAATAAAFIAAPIPVASALCLVLASSNNRTIMDWGWS